jgi:hypothetical protein
MRKNLNFHQNYSQREDKQKRQRNSVLKLFFFLENKMTENECQKKKSFHIL